MTNDKLADALDAVALGRYYDGVALALATAHPCLTPEDSRLVLRYTIGLQHGTDHVSLQDLAIRIRNYNS